MTELSEDPGQLPECPTCRRPTGISDGDNGRPPVDLSRCARTDGWECLAVAQATRDLRAELDDAKAALGPAWMHGGASLADGIRRKTAAMERLAMPKPRKKPGATLAVEREDGSVETTTYGGDR